MSADEAYRYCVVPHCTNTKKTTPDKMFVHVPRNAKTRRLWFGAMNRDKFMSTLSTAYVCEDHFDIETDIENYLRHKLMGSGPIKVKSGVVPHKFDCQKNRTTAHTKEPRPLSLKRARNQQIQDLLSNVASTSTCIDSTHTLEAEDYADMMEEGGDEEEEEEEDLEQFADMMEEGEDGEEENLEQFAGMMEEEDNVTQGIMEEDLEQNVGMIEEEVLEICQKANLAEKSTDTRHLIKFRSKDVQVKPSTKNRGCSPILFSKNVALSPFKMKKPRLNVSEVFTDSESESSEEMQSLSSNYNPSSTDQESSMSTNVPTVLTNDIKTRLYSQSLFYLGLPSNVLYLIEILAKHSNSCERDVLLCLKKIRLNEPYIILGQDFNISPQHAGAIFTKVLPSLGKALSKFVMWPTEDKIWKNLPIAFRARYSRVSVIIDCFEIAIEKPSNSLHQALTWSDYKRANTIKYLIGCTPDGTCCYISCGFGGRATDTTIVKESGFLDVIKPGMQIMADRGFKNIEHDLSERGASLVRPPSTSAQSGPMSKANARLTKQVAALRIHIERVIGRLRHFNFLAPHRDIDNKLTKYLDLVTTVACALINVQSPILQS